MDAGKFSAIRNASEISKAAQGVVMNYASHNIAPGLQCEAIQQNKVGTLAMLSGGVHHLNMMAGITQNYQEGTSQAAQNVLQRKIDNNCSVDETAMGLCMFSPDGVRL